MLSLTTGRVVLFFSSSSSSGLDDNWRDPGPRGAPCYLKGARHLRIAARGNVKATERGGGARTALHHPPRRKCREK